MFSLQNILDKKVFNKLNVCVFILFKNGKSVLRVEQIYIKYVQSTKRF